MDSRDQLLLNHAPQVYILTHSDLTLTITCFDFELKLRVVRLLFNITIYYLIPWHFRVALLPKKSLPTTWLTRYSGKQVLGAPLVIALATSTTVYSRVILLDCEQLHVYYHYLSATWSTAGSFYWCGHWATTWCNSGHLYKWQHHSARSPTPSGGGCVKHGLVTWADRVIHHN